MSRTTITPTGTICYRSKCLPLSIAASFAKCVQANATRFCDVEIQKSDKSRSEKFFVTFRPVNPTRQADLYEAQYNARAERAQQEGSEYIFWKDTDNPGTDWCFNPVSGETYQVSTFSCSCPDYLFRCEKAGLLCKHQQARTLQFEAGTLGKTDKVTRREQSSEAKAARAARCLASLNSDF
jgi:hypothetical protein